MNIAFVKMHGLGNDFIVIDGVNQSVDLYPEQVRKMADRHFGIGCDQVLLVEPSRRVGGDFAYRIFNADGSEVAQCGNGARCFARFVREQRLSDADRLVVDTSAGRLILHHLPNGEVMVDMGVPKHAPADIPMAVPSELPVYRLVVDGQDVCFGAVSLGNPHAVLTVGATDTAPVESLGALLECHDIFPEKANVGFMQILSRSHIRLRVFERGSGETLACGSGACAAAVVGIEQGVLDSAVRIDLPGGTLHVQWDGRGRPVFMTGPAVTVFRGVIKL